MERVSKLPAWMALSNIQKPIKHNSNFINSVHSLRAVNMTYDFNLQHVEPQVLSLLIELAKQSGLEQAMDDYFCGKKLNFTEERAVLHTALRAPLLTTQSRVNETIATDIQNTLESMASIANKVREGQWLGHTGKVIKNIVNIGIGGSDLGPQMALTALKRYMLNDLNYFFISDADSSSLNDVVEVVDLDETLFIVVSKSFSTRETLMNAQKIRELYKKTNQSRLPQEVVDCHFIAVTANHQRAEQFGISQIFSLWDWVGGRFSFCSTVNLILMIAIGEQAFKDLLQGAYEMDEHFYGTPFEQNLPIMLAMLGIYNINFRQIHNHSVLVYNSRLKYFSDYLQQLEMESNGKSLNRWAEKISYKTCPVIWGGIGNRAQHAYYQLLVQGTQKVSLDFIFDASRDNELVDAYGQNKINILSKGKSTNDWSHIEGKQPVNTITLDNVSPYTLGSLIALYEHKVFVQGWIWQINSFDQFGVESAKQLTTEASP